MKGGQAEMERTADEAPCSALVCILGHHQNHLHHHHHLHHYHYLPLSVFLVIVESICIIITIIIHRLGHGGSSG